MHLRCNNDAAVGPRYYLCHYSSAHVMLQSNDIKTHNQLIPSRQRTRDPICVNQWLYMSTSFKETYRDKAED